MGLAVSLLISHVGIYVRHICGNENEAVSSWKFIIYLQISLLYSLHSHGTFFIRLKKVCVQLIF